MLWLIIILLPHGIVDQPQERDYRSVEQESKKSKLRLVFPRFPFHRIEKQKVIPKVQNDGFKINGIYSVFQSLFH